MPLAGKRDTLPMITAGRGNHPGHVRYLPPQFVEIDESAADFERAYRSVVLVLNPDFSPDRGVGCITEWMTAAACSRASRVGDFICLQISLFAWIPAEA